MCCCLLSCRTPARPASCCLMLCHPPGQSDKLPHLLRQAEGMPHLNNGLCDLQATQFIQLWR